MWILIELAIINHRLRMLCHVVVRAFCPFSLSPSLSFCFVSVLYLLAAMHRMRSVNVKRTHRLSARYFWCVTVGMPVSTLITQHRLTFARINDTDDYRKWTQSLMSNENKHENIFLSCASIDFNGRQKKIKWEFRKWKEQRSNRANNRKNSFDWYVYCRACQLKWVSWHKRETTEDNRTRSSSR
jgi:uncharacterized membrane protein YhaH (DUF805 family)